MNKNRIQGLRWRASEQMIAKPISIKLTGGKSGGCASKAVELTSGDLRHVTQGDWGWRDSPWPCRRSQQRAK